MLAEKLGIPYQAAQRCTTATEFLRWQEYFRREDERKMKTVEKIDFYLAQLAAITCQVWGSSKGKKPTLQDFIIKFDDKPPQKRKAQKDMTAEELAEFKAERARIAKSRWMGTAGKGMKKAGKGK